MYTGEGYKGEKSLFRTSSDGTVLSAHYHPGSDKSNARVGYLVSGSSASSSEAIESMKQYLTAMELHDPAYHIDRRVWTLQLHESNHRANQNNPHTPRRFQTHYLMQFGGSSQGDASQTHLRIFNDDYCTGKINWTIEHYIASPEHAKKHSDFPLFKDIN